MRAERDTILRLWNDTAMTWAFAWRMPWRACAADGALRARATLPGLFAAQAARTPDAAAVMFEDRVLSYAALDAHANRWRIICKASASDPRPSSACCVERSPEMVVGLLGILKAGGAYLPLDPNYPPRAAGVHAGRRRRAGAGDATGAARPAARRGRDAAHPPRHLVRLDADWPAIARQPATAPPLGLDPAHPAYVIYTSGSTGNPKGVVVGHGGLPTSSCTARS